MSDKKLIGNMSINSLNECIDFKKLSKKIAGMGKYKNFSLYIEAQSTYCVCEDCCATYEIYLEGEPKVRKLSFRRKRKKK